MSNDSGTYIGALLITTGWREVVIFHDKTAHCSNCDIHYNLGTRFCADCGEILKEVKTPVTNFMSFDDFALNTELDETLQELEVSSNYQSGTRFYVSNKSIERPVYVTDKDGLSEINIELICQMKGDFSLFFYNQISLLEKNGIKCEVVFGVVNWEQY